MAQRISGASSYYGGPNDKLDNDKPALQGATNARPGIAVYNKGTLGGYWRVSGKDGKGRPFTRVVQQTDIGPAPWTGKKVDLNHTFIKQLGYTEGNYNNGQVSAEYLGKGKQNAAQSASQGSQGAAPQSDQRTQVLQQLMAQQPDASSSFSQGLTPTIRRKATSLLLPK